MSLVGSFDMYLKKWVFGVLSPLCLHSDGVCKDDFRGHSNAHISSLSI